MTVCVSTATVFVLGYSYPDLLKTVAVTLLE